MLRFRSYEGASYASAALDLLSWPSLGDLQRLNEGSRSELCSQYNLLLMKTLILDGFAIAFLKPYGAEAMAW